MEASKIAIVGLAGKFPGAANVNEFWQNLCEGKESIKTFSDEELRELGVDEEQLKNPNYIKSCGYLPDIEKFAADFFKFTPMEAKLVDPQIRAFLECAWTALEDAGEVADSYPGRVGVYAGAGINSYIINNILPNKDLLSAVGALQIAIGNKTDFLTTTLSHRLNLKGPSVNINTACSTSLVAINRACESLLNHECDMAIAGGVSIQGGEKPGYIYQQGGVHSPDGHCRAFDAQAKGTVTGNGVGLVILKRLEDALTENNQVYAVICGSAINNDGGRKVGFTAPSVQGQTEVIATAMAIADIEPETISYLEAHGTGTTVGDPIEVKSLTNAYRLSTDKKGFCALGSVKPNVGHLDAAAGVVSLIKTALCLKHQKLVPSINYQQANSSIDFENSPFYVNTEYKDWQSQSLAEPLRAGVSSFGIGGTNAHTILEQSIERLSTPSKRQWKILNVSAENKQILQQHCDNLRNHLQSTRELPLDDVAFTLQRGRKEFPHRRAFLCNENNFSESFNVAEFSDLIVDGEAVEQKNVTFLFPGIGDQYANMAINLYQNESAFRDSFDKCCEIVNGFTQIDLRELVYPEQKSKSAKNANSSSVTYASQQIDLRALMGRAREGEVTNNPLSQTKYAHVALFAVEYALAQLWESWGVKPTSLIGHSLGEYTAACIAGVFSLEDALKIVAARAQLIDELPAGSMLAVTLSEEKLTKLLSEGVSIAAVNGPSLTVASGESEAIKKLQKKLTKQGVASRALNSSHAFHSSMMESIQQALLELMSSVKLKAPQIPYISNLTGTWITEDQATDPRYWVRHTCQKVRFSEGVTALSSDSNNVFIEIGPGQSLASFVTQVCATKRQAVNRTFSSLPSADEHVTDEFTMIHALASLWAMGVPIDWDAYYRDEKRQKVSLPTYPWQRLRHWVEPLEINTTEDKFAQKGSVNELVWRPQRKVKIGKQLVANDMSSWLLFAEEGDELGEAIYHQLLEAKQQVIVVKPGLEFTKLNENTFSLRADDLSDYQQLWAELNKMERQSLGIVHLWPYSHCGNIQQEILAKGYFSLNCIARVVGENNEKNNSVYLATVSRGLYRVLPSCSVNTPVWSTLAGASRVIPLEYSRITCSMIDLPMDKESSNANELSKLIINQFAEKLPWQQLAYRHHQCWLPCYLPLLPDGDNRIDTTNVTTTNTLCGGTHLLYGFSDDASILPIAEFLASSCETLILAVELGLPPENSWEAYIKQNDEETAVKKLIKNIIKIQKIAKRVVVIAENDSESLKNSLTKEMQLQEKIHSAIFFVSSLGYALINSNTKEADNALLLEINRMDEAYAFFNRMDVEQIRWVTSGIGSIGNAGRSSYCAVANYALALSQKCFADENKSSICLAIDRVESDTNLVKFLPPPVVEAIEKSQEGFALSTNLIKQQLKQAFSSQCEQVIVTKNNINELIKNRHNRCLPLPAAEFAELINKNYVNSNTETVVEPEGEIEQAVASLWSEVLGIEQIGRNDHFFRSGGSSLLAVQLVARVRELMDVNFVLKNVFDNPILSNMALVVEQLLIASLEKLSEDEAQRLVADASVSENDLGVMATPYVLPNKQKILQFNQVETEHFYHDIFESRVYAKNGINLTDHCTVFDVGANIGLFSLFVLDSVKNPQIYSFEPAPPVFDVLCQNLADYAHHVTPINIGISDRSRIENLVYYPLSTGMSSFHADEEEEKEVLRKIMENQLEKDEESMKEVYASADTILERRFQHLNFDCHLKTLSQVITEQNVEKIDLLKIDVQKCEHEVIAGIEACHWPLIKQVVIEVHDLDNRLQEVSDLLESKGFRVTREQDQLYAGSDIWNFYAIRG